MRQEEIYILFRDFNEEIIYSFIFGGKSYQKHIIDPSRLLLYLQGICILSSTNLVSSLTAAEQHY